MIDPYLAEQFHSQTRHRQLGGLCVVIIARLERTNGERCRGGGRGCQRDGLLIHHEPGGVRCCVRVVVRTGGAHKVGGFKHPIRRMESPLPGIEFVFVFRTGGCCCGCGRGGGDHAALVGAHRLSAFRSSHQLHVGQLQRYPQRIGDGDGYHERFVPGPLGGCGDDYFRFGAFGGSDFIELGHVSLLKTPVVAFVVVGGGQFCREGFLQILPHRIQTGDDGRFLKGTDRVGGGVGRAVGISVAAGGATAADALIVLLRVPQIESRIGDLDPSHRIGIHAQTRLHNPRQIQIGQLQHHPFLLTITPHILAIPHVHRRLHGLTGTLATDIQQIL
mmetsp:Transcript_54760/g.65882  ORF Transcript_54760/g.65882 Transcript_54760/m.65882 type:complete len:332 (-) Transcript_54760:1776-2771(-)